MPLNTASKIYEFYENINKDFIGYIPIENASKRRYENYNILTKHIKNKYKILNFMFDVIREGFIIIQKCFFYNRTKNINIKFGPSWCDLKDKTVKYIVSKEEEIYKTYSHMRAPDELYKQTLIFNNKNILKSIYQSKDAYEQCKRMIDWNRGRPYVWKIGDFNELIHSNRMFARKFDINIDKEIVDKIYNYIKNGEDQ